MPKRESLPPSNANTRRPVAGELDMTQVSAKEIRNDVETIIRRIRPDFKGEIQDSDRLREDIGLDSLHSMELLSAITEKYEVDVDVEEVADVKTVGDIVAVLTSVLH
jgi:acyl carrier protein